MKRDPAAFSQVIFIASRETLERRDALQARLKEVSEDHASLPTAALFDISLCALAREVALDPVQSVRLFIPKNSDLIRVMNLDGVSHYCAYRIIKGLDASGKPTSKRARVSGRGVYPYPVKEGWYKVK